MSHANDAKHVTLGISGRHAAGLLAGLLIIGPASAAEPVPAKPTISADGAAVLDPPARLAWARCVEGMQWTGKFCHGTPQLMSFSQAVAHARGRSQADGLAWRLPRVQELQRLVQRTASKPVGPDPLLFPDTPHELFWSATAQLGGRASNPYNYGTVMRGGGGGEAPSAAMQGWAVHLGSGAAHGDVSKSSRLLVRLVRTLD
jgi:hypothetical protein